MLKFFGDIVELRIIVNKTNIRGTWKSERLGNSMKHSFRSVHGGVFNWWTTGTISFQGKEYGRSILERALSRYLHDDQSYHDDHSDEDEYDYSMDFEED
jgi:hypothetical protein